MNSCDDYKDPRSTDKSHIFLFGGSTTLGYGVKDTDTIAAFLEKILNENSKHCRVFNCGRQSYFSTIEAISFQRTLQEGARINIAVFIDGINDVFHNCPVFRNRSRYSEHIEKFWDNIDYLYGRADRAFPWLDSGKVLARLIAQMPVVKLAKELKKKIIRELMREDAQNTRFNEPWAQGYDADDIDIAKLAERISQLTLTNWSIIRGIAQQFHIKPLFCLQPVCYINTPLDKQPFRIKNEHPIWKKIYERYYEYMRNNSTAEKDFADLSTTFKYATHYPLVDSHHYSPYGNKLIAEAIAGYIRKVSNEKK